jgi:very-short-patch-repair endonuclease
VATHQLLRLGIPESQIASWARSGYLQRRLPAVYTVGLIVSSAEADLTASLLWAGPGAMLSHVCGTWWLGLTHRQPDYIELCTPRHCRSRQGIVVHGRSTLERRWYGALPTPAVPDLLLQFATTATHDELRKALAEAEYRGLLDASQIRAVCGRGRPGSARLKAALARHLPQLALTRNRFERRLLYLCEKHRLPLPECDVHLYGFQIDALWREQKLIVELDGKDGHAPWARIKRDHHRDLVLRTAGFTTLRYVWDQFEYHGDLVAADIAAAL